MNIVIRRDFPLNYLLNDTGLVLVVKRFIHDVIFQSSDEIKCAFLRGLFQADGCVRIRRRGKTSSGDVCLTTISKD